MTFLTVTRERAHLREVGGAARSGARTHTTGRRLRRAGHVAANDRDPRPNSGGEGPTNGGILIDEDLDDVGVGGAEQRLRGRRTARSSVVILDVITESWPRPPHQQDSVAKPTHRQVGP
jgi:hypothetical protein